CTDAQGLKSPTKTEGNSQTQHPFSVEIAGISVTGIEVFPEIESSNEVIHDQNGDASSPQYRPGTNQTKLTLIRSIGTNGSVSDWRKVVMDSKVARKAVSVIMHNDKGQETRMDFYDCTLSKWQPPSYNPMKTGPVTESLELTCGRFELKKN